jgi:hypothetical protein
MPGIATTDKSVNHQLRIGIHRNPCPLISVTFEPVFGLDVALFCVNETPDLIHLHALRFQIPHSQVVILLCDGSSVGQEPENRNLGSTQHAGCRCNAVTLDKSR